MQSITTVFIAEDQNMVRDGYCSMLGLQSDIHVVGEAVSSQEAIDRVLHLRPDVVLMDLGIPSPTDELGGLHAIENICNMWSEAKILVVTGFSGDERIVKALKYGAMGYITKKSPFEEVIRAIREVSVGNCYLASDAVLKLRERIRGSAELFEHRELVVLKLGAKDLTIEDTAEVLNVSASTVKAVWQAIFTKLGVREKALALDVARERGFI